MGTSDEADGVATTGGQTGGASPLATLRDDSHRCRLVARAWVKKSPHVPPAFPQQYLILQPFCHFSVLNVFTLS